MASAQTPGYRAQVTYRAPAAAVFDAAATPGGENGWWSVAGDVASAVGRPLRLEWSPTDYVVFDVERLERPREMSWRCVEQHDANLPDPREWVGTALSFRFTAAGDGLTVLDFAHLGLEPALECYRVCERGWDFFLRRSLKGLIELGTGLPYSGAQPPA